MKHRISEVDGFDDYTEDEVTAKVTLEEPAIFEMGTDRYPKVKIIDPGVTPPSRVFHPDLGVGDNLEQTELWNATWWKYTFKPSSADLVRPGEVFQRMIYQVKKSCF